MHNTYKKVIAFWLVPLFAFLQIVNIYFANQPQSVREIFQIIIQQISKDTFVCQGSVTDITRAYYLFQRLYQSNVIHTLLLSAIIIALIIYFRETKSKSALVLFCMNVVLYLITAVPFLLERLYGTIIKPSIYDFAFLTANYQDVPSIVVVYAVLIAGYVFFFVCRTYNYIKHHRAVSNN